MVVAEGEVGHVANADRVVPEVVLHDDGPLLDHPGAEDRDLRLVDDRRPEEIAEDAHVGDREGAALDVVEVQCLGSGLLGERVRSLGQPHETQSIGVPEHGHDKLLPVIQRHRDSEVDVGVVDDTGPVHRRVQDRVLLQALHHRLHDERSVRQLDALRVELRSELPAELDDALEVDLADRCDVGRHVLGHEHVLHRAEPDAAHVLYAIAFPDRHAG